MPDLTVSWRFVELRSMDQGRVESSTSQICQAPRDVDWQSPLGPLRGAGNSHGVTSASTTAELSSRSTKDLCGKDKSLVTLFLAASSHQWQLLPGKRVGVAGNNCLPPLATVVMTRLQILEELATSTTAVLRKCEAA